MRILIADDEPSIVVALEFLLRQAGYEVSVARDGDEAVAKLERERPELVLLDVMMPQRSGYEVCRHLRARPELAGTKVIMLSARGGARELERGMEAGADLYVMKPFSNRELLERIRGLLSR
ncbi:MAG TPA: response regulator [Burkholderiales bacterium]|nr:response regulator [Burkholderiales bacterium]